MKKILWGICGIGHGHIFRQLPLIEHYAKDSRILIFGYGESYDFFKNHFADNPNIRIEKVAVPFYVGNKDGLDFEATIERINQNPQDFSAINAKAMAVAQKEFGKFDLVISDYDPISAQYAYATNSPLVTLDQQSKYLCGEFKAAINGHTYADEVQRLRMFFPKAKERLACSFFNVTKKPDAEEEIQIYPSVLSQTIMSLNRNAPRKDTSILIYVSAQQPFGQSFEEIADVCANFPDVKFHLFGKNIPALKSQNLIVYKHGDPAFHKVMEECSGMISTAGHSLLSEAMHLAIPVYAIPLPLYEQHMNATVIMENKFGLSYERLDKTVLEEFIRNMVDYEDNIKSDNTVLLREPGQNMIIERLDSLMQPG